jgi:hypothetical protein
MSINVLKITINVNIGALITLDVNVLERGTL